MPVGLPVGQTPVLRSISDDRVLTAGERTVTWRFELLDRDERPIGTLDGVDGGSVDWTANASVKGGGQLELADVGQQIDWLNCRIRPVCTIDGYSEDVPVGVWLPAAPTESWTATGRTWTVDLLDKATILDTDVWSDLGTGQAATYSAPAGAVVTSLVRELIETTGESAPAIEDDPASLTRAMVWEIGTSRLRIINDLLDAAGFFSLWVDMAGQFRATRYTSPSDRPPRFEAVGPFQVGDTALWSPDFSVERDIFAVPNRVVAIAQGDGEDEAMTSEATNTNPDSPFSFDARGRWITVVETDVEAVDQQALDLYATRRLETLTSVSAALPVQHVWLPGLAVNETVRVVNPDAGLDILATVAKTSVTFDPVGLCSSELREVIRL